MLSKVLSQDFEGGQCLKAVEILWIYLETIHGVDVSIFPSTKPQTE